MTPFLSITYSTGGNGAWYLAAIFGLREGETQIV